jgi:Domain of unknown function (DUF4440)
MRIRRAWLFAIPLIATTLTTKAAEPTTCSADTAALIALEQRWGRALEKPDTTFLAMLLATNYVDTDETGHRGDKETALRILESHTLKIRKLTLSSMKVSVYGNAAVVTGIGEQDGTYNEQAIARKVAFTDTFVCSDGEWKAVAAQRTAIQ